jgi:hypothetical protein
MVTVSVGDHGPAVVAANEPPPELDARLTANGWAAVTAAPLSRSSTVSPVVAPAETEGAPVSASAGTGHEASVCQAVVNAAPARLPEHHMPPAPQAPTPGSPVASTSPESRTAAASRSRIAAVCALYSAVVAPQRFFGDHANPKRSSGRWASCHLAA